MKEKVEIKNIKLFKPTKIEVDKKKDKNINVKNEEKTIEEKKIEEKILKNKLKKEAKLRFKSFHELIIKYFKKAKLMVISEKKKFNKYIKIYKKHELNHMVLNKIIDNRAYTITVYLPILNIEINEVKETNNKTNKGKDKKNTIDKNEKNIISKLVTQITYRRNDLIFFNKYKIELPIIEENEFYNDELREKIIEVLLNEKIDINFAWIIFLYYFENYFSTYKSDLENRAKTIVNTKDKLIDGNIIKKNLFMKNNTENDFTNIQKDYIYYYINNINKDLYNITQ